MKLLSFGEVLFDVFPDGERLGGAPLNLAAHAAIQGAEAFLLSAVGRDLLGKRARREVQALGVNTDYVVSLDDKGTGRCIVTLDENAVPSYDLLSDVAYDYIPSPDFKEKFDIFCFGTLALRSEYNLVTVKKVIESKSCEQIYCDLNIRAPFSTERAVRFCLENANFVKISDEELPFVTRVVLGKEMGVSEAINALCERFKQIKILIITLGADGSVAYDAESHSLFRSPAHPTNVVSTVGAGDSFGATFITQFFSGKGIDECLRLASAVSSFVVSQKGAVPDGINEFIEKM